MMKRVDTSRLEEFGPDRVAAEWVLRNGGGVKFLHHNGWVWNYNALVAGPREKYKLQKINGKNTCITTGGLLHLEGLKYLDYLNLHGCKYVGDVNKLLPVKETLEELDISLCTAITDISPLSQLKKLKKLNLTGLQRIKNREKAVEDLQKTLPDCEITDD
ncbi:ATP synthase subunit s, mitochondrial-like isoform X2 [Actinia tenebrosa]|uniref:ATP synthase subunit s, mitochondrial-like isoform X2 n=1 Tax=Actinia tenebrosa TaxID=6105 RepID=A0A6P8IUN2_ACTTE|nr:ATP synthase subunit s, mitochondrial-like isoform X2 [Actinia tenebrosa]